MPQQVSDQLAAGIANAAEALTPWCDRKCAPGTITIPGASNGVSVFFTVSEVLPRGKFLTH